MARRRRGRRPIRRPSRVTGQQRVPSDGRTPRLGRSPEKALRLRSAGGDPSGRSTMRGKPTVASRDAGLGRRGLIKFAGLATATAIVSERPFLRLAHAAALTPAQREKLTPDDVVALMKAG